ncbi:uncharacterized protein BDZ83DRAFT_632189 [Colletotrichum acutatum]|uniref:Uncharacterized protein n=1 Tax=Glomerella acutata TaxID=27357 RepID=A0AAD8UEB4_GLOAC|nr:uncharacterized protein BDZ83DRAFT_632189 [Colletotrichum acutatum]KAK1719309.1 hypothetical protein BDZ83DRAFT_632189 [Colletotrichum acutatum]
MIIHDYCVLLFVLLVLVAFAWMCCHCQLTICIGNGYSNLGTRYCKNVCARVENDPETTQQVEGFASAGLAH